MKKLMVLALFCGVVAVAVWYAVRALPRADAPAGGETTRPSRLPNAPPLPLLGPSCGGHCGTERWLVKTLSDPDRDCVDLTPVDATVEQLAQLEAPARRPAEGRVRPVECTVFRVEAFLPGWEAAGRLENDGDTHVFLFGRSNQRVSLIGEIPSLDCAGACRSGFSQQYVAARTALEEGVLRPNPEDLPIVVRVTGVGFFDRLHGQKESAPNGFELHPVLSVEFLPLGGRTASRRPMSPAARSR